MDFKDPQVQKSMIVGILILIFGYVYFFTAFMPFFFSPQKAKINTLTGEYEKMSAELEKARQTVGNLAKLESEYNRLHTKWVAAQSLLPQEKEVAKLLRKITRAGNQAGVEFSLFQPQPQVRQEFVTENPVKIIVQGQYHDIGIFLSKVANLDRIINVTGLHIKNVKANSSDKNKVGRDHTIEAEMTMIAYTLQEGGAVADDITKKKS
ncbi:MAG: type 4a pilus biogenesis protein PilO [Candidatus Krumholzibacteriota bacterium]|nr:type 4a pilus biogenesis protein PilO [Candidatus Krumholzibacteriota bacterium]